MRPTLAAFAALLVISPAVRAQEPERFSEALFAEKAAIGGHFEVASGKAAILKTGNPEVKKVAEELVRDHTRANEKLMAVASSKSMKLPKGLDAKHREIFESMERLSGAAFDKHFIKEQILAHKKTVAMFEHEIELGKDADLKAFASETLPKLKEHTRHIEMVAEAIGVNP